MPCGLFNLHQRDYNNVFGYWNITSFIDNHTLDSTVKDGHGVSVRHVKTKEFAWVHIPESGEVLLAWLLHECRAGRSVTYRPFRIPYHWCTTVNKLLNHRNHLPHQIIMCQEGPWSNQADVYRWVGHIVRKALHPQAQPNPPMLSKAEWPCLT